MKKIGKNILIFLAGAIAYQILLIAMTGEFSDNNKALKGERYAMSTTYFKKELSNVCEHLEKEGCGCTPYVQTEPECDVHLQTFIELVYRNISEDELKELNNISPPTFNQ